MRINLSFKTKMVLLFVSFCFFVGFVIFISMQGKRAPQTTEPLGLPAIPAFNQQQIRLDNQVKESDFKFPKTLPILRNNTTGGLTLQESKEIASKFGFDGDPQVLKDAFTGTFYLWTNEKSSLDITPGTRKVKYSQNVDIPSSPKRLSEKDLVKAASDFLKDKGLFPEGEVDYFVNYYRLSNEQDLEGGVQSNIQSADFAFVNFSINSSGYKILTLDPTKSPLSVKVLPDGEISEVDIIKYGNISQTDQVFELKSFEDFQSSLNKATIVSLDEGRIINPDPRYYKIQGVKAQSLDLVYLALEDNLYFQPVFLIKGIANISGLGDVSAYLYLSAVK